MIPVPSEIQGKEATFGEIREPFIEHGFILGGNWEYEHGYFDAALERDGGETIYLRLPVEVIEGALDDSGARLKFQQPFIVRHVVHTQLASDSIPLVDQLPFQMNTLVNQFQTPEAVDGEIHRVDQRVQEAQAAIAKLMRYVR
ncbi:YugN family protein [Ammoniphilus sp. YIM 78166]|uniref:YugN family protein n=1 Tax=Ammoniphilus sp. YIM 78166 TaxID=1644106 RepID=UPI00106FA9BB|nr:YugN family protein [Ammoniphilus sp. YIM 78166]